MCPLQNENSVALCKMKIALPFQRWNSRPEEVWKSRNHDNYSEKSHACNTMLFNYLSFWKSIFNLPQYNSQTWWPPTTWVETEHARSSLDQNDVKTICFMLQYTPRISHIARGHVIKPQNYALQSAKYVKLFKVQSSRGWTWCFQVKQNWHLFNKTEIKSNIWTVEGLLLF